MCKLTIFAGVLGKTFACYLRLGEGQGVTAKAPEDDDPQPSTGRRPQDKDGGVGGAGEQHGEGGDLGKSRGPPPVKHGKS